MVNSELDVVWAGVMGLDGMALTAGLDGGTAGGRRISDMGVPTRLEREDPRDDARLSCPMLVECPMGILREEGAWVAWSRWLWTCVMRNATTEAFCTKRQSMRRN